MRITGGAARGIPLMCPKGDFVRPATDRMREAVFSSLGDMQDTACLDLFAGVGSYGLEALSRGAGKVTFVEKDRKCLQSLDKNLQAVKKSAGTSAQTQVLGQDVFAWLGQQKECTQDIIFLDPPYPLIAEKGGELLDVLRALVQPDVTLLFEMPGDCELSHPAWKAVKRIGRQGKDAPTIQVFKRSR